jgi:YgiT-type zinc finger domain-containing protein
LGALRETRTTYLRQLDGYLVSVSNVLTWVCDVCGERSYDEEMIARLEALLGPEAALSHTPPPRTRQRPAAARSRDLRNWT